MILQCPRVRQTEVHGVQTPSSRDELLDHFVARLRQRAMFTALGRSVDGRCGFHVDRRVDS
jgi:hypothetical protein